jgi:two-component system sensor histidine kinase QseC
MASDDPDVLEHALSNLTRGIDRTTRLVEQLLALSRLDSLSGVEGTEDIDWTALLRTILDDFSSTAARRKIDLRLEKGRASFSAKGHELLLSLLLRNLIDNALSHAPEGGTVRVSLSEKGVCVEDNGPGIQDEYLPRLGERFFRLPGQDRTGTGLGLSIAKRIAELHGFPVVFSNRLEGGFRACLYLTGTIENEECKT